LEFTKTPIKESLLLACDELNKEAVLIFKAILEYMGDRKPGFVVKDINEIAYNVIKVAVDNPQLRDELYVQLVRQTTQNPSEKSEERGWEFICMVLETYMLPSFHIEIYLKQHFQHTIDKSLSPKIRQFASYTKQRLDFLIAKPKTAIIPNMALLNQAKEIPFISSVFRSTLDQIMDFQKDTHPDLEIPIVLKTIIDLIIVSGGLISTGIFRVAAQHDEITMLRLKLEESHGQPISGILDPNVPACVLKLWLSEILKPIIPAENYYAITDNAKDWDYIQSVIQNYFPIHNRNCLYYLFNFLQRVMKEENKMNAQNIALVISPNLCRCPSSDPLLAVKQTMMESEFVVTLLNNLPNFYPIFLKEEEYVSVL